MQKYIASIALVFTVFLCGSGNAETITIEQAVNSAFSIHPAVKVARAGYNQALGNRLIELSPDPASVALEHEGVPGGQSINTYEERRLSLSQKFDFPLKYIWRAKVASVAVDEARIKGLTQLLELELEVRKAYVQAWVVEQQTKILEENAEAADNYARQLKRLVELGESSPLEERRAKVEALQASTKRDAAIKRQAAILETFQSLTGIDIAGNELEAPLEFVPSIGSRSDGGFNLNESNELKSALMQLTIADIEAKAAIFSWLPDLGVSYFQQNVPSETNPEFWGVELEISLPVWFWLSGRGKIQVSKANQRSARANIEHLRLQQQTEAVALNQAQQSLRNELQLYDEQILPLAEEAYDLAMKSYRLGEANYLEVIDAQRTFLDIQLDHLERKAALADVTSEIDRLVGRSIISHDKLLNFLNRGQ